MLLVFDDRPSDSPFVERIWRSHSERAGTFHSIAACHWEMVVTRHEGKTSLTVRGPETRATMADCPAYGEWFAIRFELGTFMPLLRPGDLRDRNDVTLPGATTRSFWLNGSAWEYPDFENAETLAPAKGLLLAGGVITALVVLFLAFDGVTKIIKVAPVVEASEKLGVPSYTLFGIGSLLLVCTAVYAIPQTAVLGAILLTGYLGGATAIHVRAGSGVFPIALLDRLRGAGLGRASPARPPAALDDPPAAVTALATEPGQRLRWQRERRQVGGDPLEARVGRHQVLP